MKSPKFANLDNYTQGQTEYYYILTKQDLRRREVAAKCETTKCWNNVYP
ncbi:hypothetical protein J4230_04430 [Candidatus Woesearchaeota archaeon]|nr:hypothetical protein [Candidatus Woesearchaeota archaeon]